jgi:hypothetical protein
VVETVGNDINVVASHGSMEKTLGFTGTESRAIRHIDKSDVFVVAAPFTEIVVHLVNEFFASSHTDDGEFSV